VKSKNQQQKMNEKARTFEGAKSQWEEHLNPTWRKWWINEAEKWQERMPEAKALLEKACK